MAKPSKKKTLRESFRDSARDAIGQFIQLAELLSQSPVMEEMCHSVPEDVRRGRSFLNIALDDLIRSYQTIIGGSGAPDLTNAFYRPILEKRNGRAYTPEEAQSHLESGLSKKGNAKNRKPDALPDFVHFLKEPPPPEAIDLANLIANQWLGVIRMLGKMNNAEDALAVNKRAEEQEQAVSQFFMDVTDEDEEGADLTALRARIQNLSLPGIVHQHLDREINRLQSIEPQSPDYEDLNDHINTVASLPWGKTSDVNTSLRAISQALDEDYHGMADEKAEILEFIAVQMRTGNTGGRALCLVGPPGIGKRSLAESIARGTGRKFASISLNTIKDDSEIHGQRLRYGGTAPGKLINAIRETGTDNPVILLGDVDEIPELLPSGDPSLALISPLDPRQNKEFKDHYIGIDYDLSKVMFICTARDPGGIHPSLADKMKFVSFPGYTREEKLRIATQHLIPRKMKDAGLNGNDISFNRQAIESLIDGYTMESGVCDLERGLEKICSKAALEFSMGRNSPVEITEKNLCDYAGEPYISPVRVPDEDEVGCVTGLAWTESGGFPLMIQVATIGHGGSDLVATGNLGKTIRESVTDAVGMIKSRAAQFGIPQDVLKKREIHVHFPESMGKDGPSAGLAIATAIISELTGIPVNRKVAMTGAIDLKGHAWEIGGLREKLEGARKAGAEIVIIPKANEKDLAKIPASIKEGLTIIPVSRIEEVLKIALTKDLKPIPEAPEIDGNRWDGTSETVFDQISLLFNILVQKLSPERGNKKGPDNSQKKPKSDGLDHS